MKIKDLFKNSVERLGKAGIEDSELEVAMLLAHLFGIDRTSLLLSEDRILDSAQQGKFEKYISRRLEREPLAYIIKEKEFWSLPFMVCNSVLIPRPETELLIEKALAILTGVNRIPDGQIINILDLGTGSGVIAVVLALEIPASEVTAIDLSVNALKVAKHNAKRHKVADRIHFIHCDWFEGIAPGVQYDLVISNPPYIPGDIIDRPYGVSLESLQPEVGNYEPRLALDGGERGLQEIIRIAEVLEDQLKPGGWFFMEIGADQADAVSDIFRERSLYNNIKVYNDYAGLPRVFQAQKF